MAEGKPQYIDLESLLENQRMGSVRLEIWNTDDRSFIVLKGEVPPSVYCSVGSTAPHVISGPNRQPLLPLSDRNHTFDKWLSRSVHEPIKPVEVTRQYEETKVRTHALSLKYLDSRRAANMADSSESDSGEPSRKRPKLGDEGRSTNRRDLYSSLSGSISPPPLRRKAAAAAQSPKIVPSPFQLTSIRDLPASSNVDAVSLTDILGDPLIAECWEFNYLHNVDFLMDAFDEDVRDLVQVHIIHGFWKNEDSQRLNLKV